MDGSREPLRDRIQKEAQPDKAGFAHSKAYHRFFEGYTETRILNPNGKGYRIQRIYTGIYHRQDLTKNQRLLLRALYVVIYLSSVSLFVSSATLPLGSNSTWYVVITQVASIPLLFWILITFFSYLPAGQDLTIDEYRSSSLALQKAALGTALSLGLTALMTLIFMFLNLSNEPLNEFLCALKYLAAGLLAFALNGVEKKVNYLVFPSANRLPIDEKVDK